MFSNSLKVGVGVLAFAFVYGAGYLHGKRVVQSDWDAQVSEQARQNHEVLLLGMKDSYDTGVAHEEQKQEIRYVTQEIVKQVPVYIRDESTCPVLPTGFSELHNRAAQAINLGIATGKFDDPARAGAPDARKAQAK